MCVVATASMPVTAQAEPPLQVITLASSSPLVHLQVMIRAGSAADPAGQEGSALMTAQMLLEGGFGDPKAPVTKEKLAEIVLPWGEGARPEVFVEKETTTFFMTVPRDAFSAFVTQVLAPMFTKPLFLESELERLRKESLEALTGPLPFENTERLGLLALDAYIHENTSYAHAVEGTIPGINSIKGETLRSFYTSHYRSDNMALGLSTTDSTLVSQATTALESIGGKPRVFTPAPVQEPPKFAGRQVLIVTQPNIIATGLQAGFPISVTRTSPDYWPLYVANIHLGTHRDSFGLLYNEIREVRGYNYGDYSYIEWFPQRWAFMFPPPNAPRSQQYFTIWIRPVAHAFAHHILKAMTWELENFVRRALTPQEVELAKNKAKILYLSLAEDTSRLLGHKLDDWFYGMSQRGYLDNYLAAIEAVTTEQVNRAIHRHLQANNLKYMIVTNPETARQLAADIPANRNAKGKSLTDYQIDFMEKDGMRIWQIPENKLEVITKDRLWEEYPLNVEAAQIQVIEPTVFFQRPRRPERKQRKH